MKTVRFVAGLAGALLASAASAQDVGGAIDNLAAQTQTLGVGLERLTVETDSLARDTRNGFKETRSGFAQTRKGFERARGGIEDNRGLIAAAGAIGVLTFGDGDGVFLAGGAVVETVTGQPAFAGGVLRRSGPVEFGVSGSVDHRGRGMVGAFGSVKLW